MAALSMSPTTLMASTVDRVILKPIWWSEGALFSSQGSFPWCPIGILDNLILEAFCLSITEPNVASSTFEEMFLFRDTSAIIVKKSGFFFTAAFIVLFEVLSVWIDFSYVTHNGWSLGIMCSALDPSM